jgi:energy-coupling factor transporter ATP-binding protein EcfA2
MSPPSNPFSTRFVRPGAIAFRFEPGASAAALVSKLKENHWRGEITGPHGSGKSTLLETLKPLLEQAGRRIIHLKLTAQQPSLKLAELLGGAWNSKTLVIIDGYEQLNSLPRWLLAARRQLTGAGMLITCHAPAGFPPLFQTCGSEQTFIRLVEELQPDGDPLVSAVDAAQALHASKGDVREALFRLYDLYESRKPGRM